LTRFRRLFGCSLFTGNLDVCLYSRNISCLIWWLLWRHSHFNFTLLDCYVLNIYRMNQIYWQTELHGTEFLRSSEVSSLLQILHLFEVEKSLWTLREDKNRR
jgi:hypothetical protein